MNMIKFNKQPNSAASGFIKVSVTALLGASSLFFTGVTAAASASLQDHHRHTEQQNLFTEQRDAAIQEKRQQAEKQTQALAKAMTDYRGAGKLDKDELLNQMITLAEKRQTLLAELAQSDPTAAVSMVLAADDREGIPAEVQALLEQQQELEGELEIFYEDYEDHSMSRLHHVLMTKSGRVELQVPANSKVNAMQSGVKVRARGWQFKESSEAIDSLLLDDELGSLSVLAQDSTTTTTSTSSTTTTATTGTMGEQQTLVVLLNFQDNPQQPWTVEETRDLVFGKVNNFYKENSSNQTWLSGDVEGYFTLAINEVCDIYAIDSYAKQAAADRGIDTSSYNRLVYIFPKNNSCGWSGMGTVGGTQSRAWINGSFTLNTIGHEMGHNFGLRHAQALDCGSNIIGEDCLNFSYGDTLDIMGDSNGHFNAFNKEYLGWLTQSSGEIVTADSEGSYLLAPYETALSGAARGLRIRRGTDSVTGLPLWYYLEYRQPVGFDSFLEGMAGITNGVVLRLATESDMQSSQLLDMTPGSSWNDTADAALTVGNSYTDSDAGVTITTEWADSTGASVHVSFTQQACIQSNPAITVASTESAGVVAGSTISYSVTVTNNDDSGCAASDYNLSANVPAGWTATTSSLSLEPGTSGTVTLDITSSDTAADDTYEIAISAVNNTDNSYSNSALTSYTVETPVEPCLLANPVFSLAANQSGDVEPGTTVSYTATITSQDSNTCEAATIDLVASVPAGWNADSKTVALAPGGTASVNLNVTSASTAEDGVYAINFTAFNIADISYNSTAVGTYTVAAPAPVCEAAAPLLSISSTAGEVVAGSTVNYSVTVTNQDSSDCSATNFALSAQTPAGWSSNSSNVTLAPGASTTVNLSVTSATTATDGIYNIVVNAQNTAESGLITSKAVSYTIANPAINSAPVAVNDTVALPKKAAIVIDVLVNDSDPEGDDLSIIAVTQGAKGTVEITADGQLLYTPAKSFKSDSFSYTISDGEKTATATVSLALAR